MTTEKNADAMLSDYPVSIGHKYVFNYPEWFTSLPAYSEHRGSIVTVLRKLSEEEADTGISESDEDYIPVFEVVCDDGWRGIAWADELKPTH